MIFVLIIGFLFSFAFISYLLIKGFKNKTSKLEMGIAIGYFFFLFIFGIGLLIHEFDYHQPIDPVDGNCYTPFGKQHILTLAVYFIAVQSSMALIWKKGKNLPPLLLTICLSLLLIGIVLNIAILTQVFHHDTSSIDMYTGSDNAYFIFAPLISIYLCGYFFIKIIQEERKDANNRTYQNPILAYCNHIITSKFGEPIWSLILLLPIFILVTLILILFGQDYNSISRVFTDTTTWTFSQKSHPPILDHTGHYLCTVAAKGNPKIVKPLLLGQRNGRTIIVNRQLQVANAFEEIISDFSPNLHTFIRKNYDKYGYNLSLLINSEKASNLTYIMMKPLEYIFLIILYTTSVSPEKKIAKQYNK